MLIVSIFAVLWCLVKGGPMCENYLTNLISIYYDP